MAEARTGTTARMLDEIDEIVASAQMLVVTLEDAGADTDELREALVGTIEKNLLECYGAPTLARYIVRNAIEK